MMGPDENVNLNINADIRVHLKDPAVEAALGALSSQLAALGAQLMTGFTDLQAADANVAAAVAAAVTYIQTTVPAQVAAAVAAAQAGDDATAEQIAQDLNTQGTTLVNALPTAANPTPTAAAHAAVAALKK